MEVCDMCSIFEPDHECNCCDLNGLGKGFVLCDDCYESHPELVKALAKSGQDIANEMTAEAAESSVAKVKGNYFD